MRLLVRPARPRRQVLQDGAGQLQGRLRERRRLRDLRQFPSLGPARLPVPILRRHHRGVVGAEPRSLRHGRLARLERGTDFYDYNVEPNDGTPADEFTFWAEYADADGDEPTSVKLRLDGKDYSMVKENAKDNDYADGVRYFFKVKGPAGVSIVFHSPHPTAPHVQHLSSGWPFVQCDDPDFNFPDLEGEVEPWDGLPSDQFEFRATYWDEEGDAPGSSS